METTKKITFGSHRVRIQRMAEEAPVCEYTMTTPDEVYRVWEEQISQDPTFEPDKEHFFTLFSNMRRRLIGYHVVSVGTVDECLAHPVEVFRAAVVAGASAVCFIHNHPSGEVSPSTADHTTTRNLAEAGRLLRVTVDDHLVVGSGSQTRSPGTMPYFSFREAGLL